MFGDKKAPPGGAAGGGGGAAGGAEHRGPSPPQPPPPPDTGSVYTAIWGFESRHPDELSFREGDLFSVLSRAGDWWMARRIDTNGRVLDTGIVPNNYLARTESLETQA